MTTKRDRPIPALRPGQRFAYLRTLTLTALLLWGGGLGQGSAADLPSATDSLPATTALPEPVLLGAYTQGYLGHQSVVEQELRQVEGWAGQQFSLAGLFFDIEDSNPAYNIPTVLGRLHQNGYTAFVNLTYRHSAAELAQGQADWALRQLARAYADWATAAPDQMALIAPLPEMNGSWEAYREDPENFRLAFERIQAIFQAEGVPPQSVRWVFAPNGWSRQGHEFERYYPGSDRVDVVAFSAYNWGFCQNAAWRQWQSPAQVFGPYVQRMQAMAPDKPVFVAQTATTSVTSAGLQGSAKDQWLQDAYAYLASTARVQGIMYFNLDKECDWALTHGERERSAGFREAIAHAAFRYIAPADLLDVLLDRSLRY